MRGFYSQGVAILFTEPPSIPDLREHLSEIDVVAETPASELPEIGGPSLTVSYRPELNGMVNVDVWPHPWPDHMGSPDEEPMLFGAWSMGHFGPGAYPGGLERAIQQAWFDADAPAVAEEHQAVVRLRLSYVFGAGDDAPVRPEGVDDQHELQFLDRMSVALLAHPQASAYFNPNGEVLSTRHGFGADQGAHRALERWTNLRMMRLQDLGEDWMLMDLVGCEQLGIMDHEVAFQSSAAEPNEVARFLRNMILHELEAPGRVKSCDTAELGSGRVVQCHASTHALYAPPRPTLRWFFDRRESTPEILQQHLEAPTKKRPWWRFS